MNAPALRAARCFSCPEAESVGRGVRCRLRALDVAEPAVSGCANHPAFGAPDASVPIGPVLSAHGASWEVLEPSPDSERIRDALMGMVDACEVPHVDDLPPRVEVALWQLVAWRERRAHVLRDRFDGEPTLPDLGVVRDAGAAEGATPPALPLRAPRRARAEPRPFVPATRRATIAVFLLGCCAALAVLAIVSNILEHRLLESALEGVFEQDEFEASDVRQQVIRVSGMGLFVLTGIAFLMWLHRAYANLRSFGWRRLARTPGWAVGVWFIPFANLFVPCQVVQELERGSRSEGHAGMGGWILIWWFAYLAMSVADRVVAAMLTGAGDIDDYVRANHADQVSQVLTIVAALLAISVVRGIEFRQSNRSDVAAMFE